MAALPVCDDCGSSAPAGRMLHCECCLKFFHGACAKAPAPLLARLQRSPSSAAGHAVRRWQCFECKRCSVCDSGENGDTMLLCDGCDEAMHMQCASPPVEVPPGADDDWYCARCAGGSCGGGPKRGRRVPSASQKNPAGPKRRRGSPPAASSSTAVAAQSPPKGRRADPPQDERNGPVDDERAALTYAREQARRRRQRADDRASDADDCALPPIEQIGCREDVALFLEAERSAGLGQSAAPQRASPADGGGAIDLVDQCDIKRVVFGGFSIATWYGSPYPRNLSRRDEIFVCEFCLKPLETEAVFHRHCEKCVWRHPPGNEIYKDSSKGLSVWEVDGQIAKTYCQSLCLLAKLWLLNKTLYFQVEPFLFYVLTKEEDDGCKIVGYFSKEKRSEFNLSCIMVMPPHMRGGYGSMLIDFSYLLTRAEGRTGSPEGPLSDLGLIAYRRYWTDVVLERIAAGGGATGGQFSMAAISQETGIHINDIASTLLYKGMIKIWTGRYMLYEDKKVLERHAQQSGRRHRLRDELLRWKPPAGSGAGGAASSSDDSGGDGEGDTDGDGRQAG